MVSTDCSPRHLLLINLGTGVYERTSYEFDGGYTLETAVAGLAVWRYLQVTERSPHAVAFIATDTAWRAKEAEVASEMERLVLDPAVLTGRVPTELPRSREALWREVGRIEEWVADHGGEHEPTLHLDLTHSFRAIPIAHTWILRYLANRGQIVPGVMAYGVFDRDAPASTPVVDLRHLVDLAEWAAAVRDFRQAFDPRALTRLLGRLERERSTEELAATGAQSEQRRQVLSEIQALVRAATSVGGAFPAGLPLDLGLQSGQHLRSVGRLEPSKVSAFLLPGIASLLRELADALEGVSVPVPRDASLDRYTKRQIALTPQEIDRQLHLVERWAEVGALSNALEAFRELLVSRVILARGQQGEWLSEDVRRAVEDRLRTAGDVRNVRLPNDERQVAELWSEIARLRNRYAHAGMCAVNLNIERDAQRVLALVQDCQRLQGSSPTAWKLVSVPADRRGRRGEVL